jgi:hypothetical protein
MIVPWAGNDTCTVYVSLGYLGVSLYVYVCVCTSFYIYVCRIDLRGLNFFTSHCTMYMNIFRQCEPLVPRMDYTLYGIFLSI